MNFVSFQFESAILVLISDITAGISIFYESWELSSFVIYLELLH